MSSLQSGLKQIPANAGYYISVGDVRTTLYQQNGTDAAPLFGQSMSTISTSFKGVSTAFAAAGLVLRDMGKTVLSSSRVFRKVQVLQATNSLVNGGTDGVGGVANVPAEYLTFYIELPGTGGMSSGSGSYTPVARLG